MARVVVSAPNRIADAHMHLWDPRAHYYPWLCEAEPIAFRYGDYRALRRPYLPADYRADSAAWPVARTVYVEAEWDPRDPRGEMDFIARIRAEAGLPSVAIAQAWLDAADCAAVLEAHAERAFVRGVRHKPGPGQMDDARWREGYARLAPLGLHFELQAPWRQLGEAARLAGDFPDTLLVVNHAGLPEDGELAGWRTAMATLARSPNVMVKISGLGNLAAGQRREATLALIELFGPRRAMFASNYPVDGLRMAFDAIFREFDQATRGFPAAERRELFHDNAVRIYRME
jgi:predicted TIM-barrel fold metal-dependent hydrolase